MRSLPAAGVGPAAGRAAERVSREITETTFASGRRFGAPAFMRHDGARLSVGRGRQTGPVLRPACQRMQEKRRRSPSRARRFATPSVCAVRRRGLPAPRIVTCADRRGGTRAPEATGVRHGVGPGLPLLLLVWTGKGAERPLCPWVPQPSGANFAPAQASSLVTVDKVGEGPWADVGLGTLPIAVGCVAAVVVVLLGMAMASRDALFQALDPARPFASRITPLARSPLLVA